MICHKTFNTHYSHNFLMFYESVFYVPACIAAIIACCVALLYIWCIADLQLVQAEQGVQVSDTTIDAIKKCCP